MGYYLARGAGVGLNHQRKRQALELFIKKMKFSPVVSIQGPRQCGKSYFARELVLQETKGGDYYSLDRKDTRDYAASNPRSFLEGADNKFMIIDEAQKVPDLFHEIKDIVDRQRTPGKFVLLGSTEFSLETRVRESLTGRLSKVRMYPFNISESLNLEINKNHAAPFLNNKPRASRKEFLRYLKNGGLPGIFGVKSELEKKELLSDWIKLTAERDLHQISKFKLQPSVANQVLATIAKLAEPTVANIAKEIKVSAKRTQTYITALEQLFVIIAIHPYKGSAGKKHYYLTDVALAATLGASFENQILTWFYLELSSILSYKGIHNSQLYYYQPGRGSRVHFMHESEKEIVAVKILSTEKFDKRDFLVFESLKKKIQTTKPIKTFALWGGLESFIYKKTQIKPWESLV